MQASNQPAQLQRLARMLKFCVYSKFINYTFQRLNNKVTDQTARPHYLRFSCDATHISVTACFNILARSIYDMHNVWSVSDGCAVCAIYA